MYHYPSVHAKIKEFPSLVICGKPEDLLDDIFDMVTGFPFSPFFETLINFISSFSIQLTMAMESSIRQMSTLPVGFASFNVTGVLKVLPPSSEKITFTSGLFLGSAYQAMASVFPFASILGPFTGHPLIFQLSAKIGFPSVHFSFSNRAMDMSRTSSSERSL